MTSFDISLGQGSDYNISLNLTNPDSSPINLNGYSISGYIKSSFGSTGYLASLNPQITSANSGIISLSVLGSQSINFPVMIGKYTVGISNGFQSLNVLYGNVYVYPSIFSTFSGVPNVVISGAVQNYEFDTNLTSGVNTQYISFPMVFNNIPRSVNCTFENSIDGYGYTFGISGITTSGFQINFSDYLHSSGYILDTEVAV